MMHYCTTFYFFNILPAMESSKDIMEFVKEYDFVFGEVPEDYLVLDCGKKIGPINIRYETYGSLNPERTNAILILHALSGDAHVAGKHSPSDKKSGWWDKMVGPGKAFDTEKYFIVCSNVLGGCSGSTGPRSINPETGKLYNMSFPVITIRDMVKAQYRLMKYLKIEKWLAIAGGSMGGMQALQWAVSYPDAVKSVIPIATTSRLSPQAIAFNWVGREAIMSNPDWKNGNYQDKGPEKGLSIARMLGHITYLSDESMAKKFGRNLQNMKDYAFNFSYNFQVESYLKYQGQSFVERFDANSYLYISRAMDYFDLSEEYDGNLTKAFESVKSDFLVISFSSDWLFPPSQSMQIVSALRNKNLNVSYCNIDSIYGHDAFLLETEVLGKLVAYFIENQFKES
ncbi:MAG TPA: homoserine O-acetyltransferase [Victivallales bacterium]|nr:homoserine O-acetyltransferase [Victivallales bacterium]HRU00937.1 homoserine O-acetyltransferase [Victivallales bacterium]